MQNAHALAHLLHAHEVTVITIAHRSKRDIKLHLVIHQIWMSLPHVVIDTAPAQVWAGRAIIDCHFLWQNADVSGAIHKNPVASQKLLSLVDVHHYLIEELAALLRPAGRQITSQAAYSSVARGETRSGQRFAPVIE